MATYTEMVQMVRDWSNRDEDVLSSANIKTFINFAADNIYRDLRIAPLEFTYKYSPRVVRDTPVNTLPIPSDAIEFIQLRKRDENSLTDWRVYAAKSDIRSFYQDNVIKYDAQYYTREGNNLIVYPDMSDSDNFELFYYRRLPEQDARYPINSTNSAAGLVLDTDAVSAADLAADPDLAKSTGSVTETFTLEDKDTDTDYILTLRHPYVNITSVFVNAPFTGRWETVAGQPRQIRVFIDQDADTEAEVVSIGYTVRGYGQLQPNWLRDENEKLILFGALAEVFTYLDEPQQAQKYMQRFDQELRNLNNEENQRKYMGGNVQLHYRSHLI